MKYRAKGEFDAFQVPFDILTLVNGESTLTTKLKKGQWLIPQEPGTVIVVDDRTFLQNYEPADRRRRTKDAGETPTARKPRKARGLGSSPLQQPNGEDQRIIPRQVEQSAE